MKLKLPRVFASELETEEMLVSVVTITLNAARDLPLTIESVAGQDFENFEYVIVDGQSWDSSHEIFKRYSKEINRIVETEDSGIYWAMNFAATQCRGKYIIFMNAGDSFYSSKSLSNVFSQLDGQDPDIIHGDHVYVDKSLELHRQSADFGITRKALLQGDVSPKWLSRFPCHQATLTKRDLLDRMGGYDTRLEICADHDFFLRAYDAGATTKYVDETIAHYFGGGISAQRSERCQLEWIKTYRSKSLFPQKIDKFFGAHQLVRYDSQSEATGAKLSGFYPLEGPSPDVGDTTFSSCAGEGFSLFSPLKLESIGIFLVGRNVLDGQRLTVTSAGETLCEIDVPLGDFKISAPFPYPIAPQSVVEVFPARAQILPGDHRFVSILLTSFHFESSDVLEGQALSLGRNYPFGQKDVDNIKPLLRGGWATPEAIHSWSIGAQSTLILPVEESAEELSILMSGNPFVADDLRQVKILVNGKPIAENLPLSTMPKAYIFSLATSEWRPVGSNFITFVPRKTASSPGDPRELGIGLYSIKLD